MPTYPQARQQAQRIADGGDPAGARAILENVIELGRPGLAAGDPELLETMRQLAGLYAQDADPIAARRLLEEAFAAGQRIGPAEPLVVLLAYDLAVVAEELANRHVARKNFALVATYGPAALGEGHPAVARARAYAAEDGISPAAPTSGPPVSTPPVSGPPQLGQPVSDSPALGQRVPESPTFGHPVSGSPALEQPVSGSPAFGQPVSPAPRPSRTPWVIAAVAVLVAVILLVVVLVRPGGDPPVAGPTTAPPPATATATATATEIVTPANGSGVAREFTVTFAVSAADVAATGTRLALTVCVKEWCFLDGPIVIEGGRAQDYSVTLGTEEGEGIGETWTVRVDRLAQPDYDYLLAHKQDATAAGTWGNGVTTPIDRLNETPVSAVVVTKSS